MKHRIWMVALLIAACWLIAPSLDPNSGGAKAEAAEAELGQKVYQQNCAMCHDAGIAGAPKTGDQAAWKDRLPKGMDTLIKHAIEGFQGESGMMPAKGGNASLSDDEVKAAVTYMVAQSR